MEDAVEMAEVGAEEGEIVEGGESIERSLEAEDSNVHPLEHSWTFWFDNPNGKSKQAAWGSSLRPVYTFSTVEDFWRYAHLYNHSNIDVTFTR